MFHVVNNAITHQLKRSIKKEVNLSEVEQIKLDYAIDALVGDITKFVLLLIFFLIIHRGIAFLLFCIVALPLRNLTGGIHMKTYNTCFLFSLFYALLALIMIENFSMDSTQLVYLSLFSIIIIFLVAPITSKSRPIYSAKKKIAFKIISSIWIIINVVVIFYIPNTKYALIAPWAIMIHSIQLLGGFLWQLFQKQKQTHLKC